MMVKKMFGKVKFPKIGNYFTKYIRGKKLCDNNDPKSGYPPHDIVDGGR